MRVRRGILTTAVLGALLLAVGAPAARADCASPCPYTAVASIGDRAGGQLRLPQGVAVDAAGEVFVADQFSGAIQRFANDGSFQMAFGAPGGEDGEFGPVVGLAYDPGDDTIYAADAANDRIQHFSTDGRFLGAFGSLGSAPGQFRLQDGGPVEDPAQGGIDVGLGRLWVADSGNDRVQSFPLADVSGSDPTTANATVVGAGLLDNPQGLDAAADGQLYVADDLHDVVRVFNADTGAQASTIGLGLGDGPGQFDGVYDVVRGADGRIYTVDDNNHRIQVFDAAVSTTAPVQVIGGYGRDPGELEFPRAMTSGPDGTLFVANTADGRVDRFTPQGGFVISYGQDARLPGQFIRPAYVSAAPDGGLGVPDQEGNRLELLDPDASLLSVLGRAGGALDQVRRPQGIGFRPDFGTWTADTDNDRVVQRDAAGTPLRAFGAAGSGDGQLETPLGAVVDGVGDVFVADSKNDRVVKLTADGVLMATFRGLPGPRGLALTPGGNGLVVAEGDADRVVVLDPTDGHELLRFGARGTDPGQFRTPGGVAVDGHGRIYVADISNDRVQRFAADGSLDVAFGSEGTDLGSFERPIGVAVACDGSVAVADAENDRVQRFTVADPATTPCVARPVLAPPPVTPPVETPIPVPQPTPAPAVVVRPVSLRLTAGLRTGVLRLRRAGIRVRCATACTANVRVTLRTTTGRRVSRTLRSRTLALRAGRSTSVVVRLSQADVRVLRRALGPRATRLRLSVRVRATGTGRRATTRTRTLAARA